MKKIGLIFFGLVLAYLVFVGLKANLFYKKIYTSSNHQPQKEKTNYTFLLFGFGGGQHEGTYLTDTMMMVHLDLKNKKAALISIPRDLWVKIPTKDGEGFYSKINAVYQMELFPQNYPNISKKILGKADDANLIKYVVAKTFGVDIDGYAAIDFEGFKKAIDLLGGVEVKVEQSFTDPEYPVEGKETDLCDKKTEELFKKAEPFLKPGYNPEDKEKLLAEDKELAEFIKNATESPELAFPCRYETITFEKGMVKMDGETALKYVRSRHALNNGGDFGRARRQQLLLEAVKDKVLSLGFITKIIPLMDDFGNHLKTDISIDLIKKFTAEAVQANQYQLTTYVFSTKNYLIEDISDDGQYILVIEDRKKTKEALKKIFQGINPDITPTTRPTVTKAEVE